MGQRSKRLFIAVILAIILFSSLLGFFLFSKEKSDWYLRQREYSQIICDGRGAEKVSFFSKDDYFTAYADLLINPDHGFRSSAAFCLTRSTIISGTAYTYLADAYLDAGRDDYLLNQLHRAWSESEDNHWVRLRITYSFCEFKRRQYLWKHPELAEKFKLAIKPELKKTNEKWDALSFEQTIKINQLLKEAGDTDFIKALKEHENLKIALRRGELKGAPE